MDFALLLPEFAKRDASKELFTVMALYAINGTLKTKMDELTGESSRNQRLAKRYNKASYSHHVITADQVNRIFSELHDYSIRCALHGDGGCREPNPAETCEKLIAILNEGQ